MKDQTSRSGLMADVSILKQEMQKGGEVRLAPVLCLLFGCLVSIFVSQDDQTNLPVRAFNPVDCI